MSPTFEVRAGFAREFARLSREQDRAFRQAVRKLVDALGTGREPPRSLRIKRVQGTRDIWEMSYSGDGRATFRYGAEVKPGETHIEWRMAPLRSQIATSKDQFLSAAPVNRSSLWLSAMPSARLTLIGRRASSRRRRTRTALAVAAPPEGSLSAPV